MGMERVPGDGSGIVLAILEQVADVEGIDTVDLCPPLYEAIDPDLIEKIVQAEGFQALRFRYLGRSVTVDANHSVQVE